MTREKENSYTKVQMTDGKGNIQVPRTVSPRSSRRWLKKFQKDISNIDQKIISMHAKRHDHKTDF